jgi:hypothetical protein
MFRIQIGLNLRTGPWRPAAGPRLCQNRGLPLTLLPGIPCRHTPLRSSAIIDLTALVDTLAILKKRCAACCRPGLPAVSRRCAGSAGKGSALIRGIKDAMVRMPRL